MYSKQLIVDILYYLDNNLLRQITMDDLSKEFFYNKDYIMRLFKKEIHSTIIEYVNRKRIFLAINQIKNTNDSMIKCAIMCGFSSLEYFSETFKQIMGVSPSRFRLFYRANKSLTIDEIEMIRIRIVKLNMYITKTDTYKINTKKKEVKKLSLFD